MGEPLRSRSGESDFASVLPGRENALSSPQSQELQGKWRGSERAEVGEVSGDLWT